MFMDIARQIWNNQCRDLLDNSVYFGSFYSLEVMTAVRSEYFEQQLIVTETNTV